MKRLMAALCALVLAMGALAGCSESAGQESQQENNNPVVTVEMANGGVFQIELYPDKAPNTVNNFISLVQKGYYDGIIFHRVEAGLLVQGGDPNGPGIGGPGYQIKGEFSNNGVENDLKHTTGVISMARTMLSYDTAGSQFFICLTDLPSLDGDYATFGKVISGMDVVQKIAVGDTMKKVTVDTKGVTYPEPEKIQ